MKGYRVSLTYEFDGVVMPLHRITTVNCTTPGTAANRALKEAKTAWKGRKPVSYVLVIERAS